MLMLSRVVSGAARAIAFSQSRSFITGSRLGFLAIGRRPREYNKFGRTRNLLTKTIQRRIHTSFKAVASAVSNPRSAKTELEDTILQSIQYHLSNFVPINIDDKRNEVDAHHKTLLSSFWKSSLAFNPLAPKEKIDIRFMPPQTTDEVYEQLKREALNPCRKRYILRAMSGAGKTGAVLNAIGRQAYMIYIEGSVNEMVDAKDFFDKATANFIDTLHSRLVVLDKADHGTKATEIALSYCRAYWLVRLMLLEYMKTEHQFTPELWIWWINDGGMDVINSVQADLFGKQKNDGQELLNLLSECCKQNKKVWFAVDEAQVLAKCWGEEFGLTSPVSKLKTNLLHLLAVHALPVDAVTIVLGTQLTKFEALEKSGGASVITFSQEKAKFPYMEPEKAMESLQQLLDLEHITPQNLARAKYQLQGRLRYVFAFVKYLHKVVDNFRRDNPTHPWNEIPVDLKNELFAKALQLLSSDIESYVFKRYTEVKNKLQEQTKQHRSKSLTVGFNDFQHHLLVLCLNYLEQTSITFSSSQFDNEFKMSPEDTGFLFFDKQTVTGDLSEYVYSIREPQMIPFVIRMLAEFFTTMANSLSEDANSAGPQARGFWLEKMFGLLMCSPSFSLFLKHFVAPKWCFGTFEWVRIIQPDDHVLMEAVKNVKKLAKAKKGTAIEDLLPLFLANNLLARLASTNDIAQSWLPILLKIAKLENERAGELLFLLIQPTEYLLRPTINLGPDLVGFYEDKSNKKVLVAVSMSFRPSEKNTKLAVDKFTQNAEKQLPGKFLKNGDRAAQQIYKEISMPNQNLLISATMPYQIDTPPTKSSTTFQIYLNEKTMAKLSKELSENLINWDRAYQNAKSKVLY